MDPISNMIVQLKNAGIAKKAHALVPASKLNLAVVELLAKHGYVGEVAKKGKKAKKFIEVAIVYSKDEPKIRGVKRVSKPSRRIYLGVRDIVPVRQGFGAGVYSTPRGLMTDKEAKQAKVGGELLFTIW